MKPTTTAPARPQLVLDKLAIGTSVLCAIHCVLLPVVLSMFPALLTLPMPEEEFHQILVWFVVPISIGASFLGCAKHKDVPVMAGITVGILLLVAAVICGHDYLGEFGEKTLTLTASAVLCLAHFRNFKLCRKLPCTESCC